MSDLENVRIAAAQLALGNASAADLKSAASSAVDAGAMTPDLAALATLRDDTLAEAEPLFRRALADLQMSLPSLDEAVWLLLRREVQGIADGSIEAEAGLKRIMVLFYDADLHQKSHELVGDSHGIEHLVGLYWELHDIEAHRTEVDFNRRYDGQLRQLSEDAIVRARKWLIEHAA